MTARADFFCSTKINLKSFNSLQQQPPVSDSLSHSKIGKPVNNGEQSRVWTCVCHQTAIAAWYELIKICQINYSTSILVINSSCIYFSNPTGHVKKNLSLPETHITVNCTLKQFFFLRLYFCYWLKQSSQLVSAEQRMSTALVSLMDDAFRLMSSVSRIFPFHGEDINPSHYYCSELTFSLKDLIFWCSCFICFTHRSISYH